MSPPPGSVQSFKSIFSLLTQHIALNIVCRANIHLIKFGELTCMEAEGWWIGLEKTVGIRYHSKDQDFLLYNESSKQNLVVSKVSQT